MKLTVEWQEVVTYQSDIEVPDDLEVPMGSLAYQPRMDCEVEGKLWMIISNLDKAPDEVDTDLGDITYIERVES